MRTKLLSLSLVTVFALMVVGNSLGRAQSTPSTASPTASPSPAPTAPSTKIAADASNDEDQEGTRGAFLTSRPKTADKSKAAAPSNTAQPRSRRRPAVATKPSSGTAKAGPSATAKNPDAKKQPIVQKMGLGLTLFMRDANGLAVRVDPTHEFRKGDRVRVLLETNADGHLYIFNTTNDGPPVMIYPDPELDEAGNYLQAHVPFEIPSSVSPQENLRWFRFDENAGIERLYFVFTREPLAGTPIEDDLIKYCGEEKKQCAWHPLPETWAQLQKQLSIPTPVARAKSDGKAQTAVEQQAASRGIGLARDDPEPSLVMMNASTDSGLLVAALDLYHR